MKEAPHFRFKAFMRQGTYAPSVVEDYTQKPWVFFGKDNLFPQRMRDLADNCGPLSTCIDSAALMFAGRGVEFKNADGSTNEAAQERWYSWVADVGEDAFLYRCFSDLALMNSVSFEVIRSASGIAKLSHLDVTGVRLGKRQEGERPMAYYSASWAHVEKSGRTAEQYKPVPLDIYDPARRTAKSLVYVKGYKQGRMYYGEPWYLPAVPHAQVWSKVAPFNQVQIDTGFMPSVHLHTWLRGDEEDLDQYDRDIERAYTGSQGRGIFHTFGNNGDEAPILKEIPFASHAGELDEIMGRSETAIYRIYGMPPVLAGIDVAGGLAGQGDALKEAFNLFLKTKAAPRQRMLSGKIEELMRADGITDFEYVEIEPLDLFEEEMDDATMREAYLASVTINEHRENEMDMDPVEGGDRFLKAGTTAPAQPTPPQE